MDELEGHSSGAAPDPPPGRRTPRPRHTVIATVLVAGLLIGGGAYLSADALLQRESTTTETIKRPVRAIELSLVYGDARISAYDGDTIQIRRTLTRSVPEPVERADFADDKLILIASCRESLGRCAADYDIKVPRATAVDATISFGDGEVRGLSGAVALKVRIGKATLDDIDGSVSAETLYGELQASGVRGSSFTARSAGGDIYLDNVASSTIDLRSGSGALTVRGTGTSRSVSAISQSGDVTVLLPRAAPPQRVEASGSTLPTVEIPPAGDGPLIYARSTTGNVTIRLEDR